MAMFSSTTGWLAFAGRTCQESEKKVVEYNKNTKGTIDTSKNRNKLNTQFPLMTTSSTQPIKDGGPCVNLRREEIVPPKYVVGKLVCEAPEPSLRLIG